MPAPSWCGNEYREGLDDLVVGVTPRFREATSSRTQHRKISVKCRQTTRAVIIYIGCDRKLLFRFSVFSSGVQPSKLHRKTDHLFGHVNRPAPPGSGGGLVHELRWSCR